MKPYTIKTREGESVSPLTSTQTVFDENGVDLDTLLADKVAKMQGKQLSTNDYTDNEKAAVATIPDKLDEEVWNGEHEQFNILGRYIYPSAGNIYSSENYAITPLIPINKEYPIIAKAYVPENASAIALYDVLGNFIGGVGNGAGINDYIGRVTYSDYTYTLAADNIPAKACYFRAGSYMASAAVPNPYYRNGATEESREGAVSDAILASKLALFVDMWNTACGSYGKYAPANAPDPVHPFYLNELWLTYEEALTIFERGVWRFNSMPAIDHTNVKTNLFAMSLCDSFDRANAMGGFDLVYFVRANQSIETLRVSTDDNEDILNLGYAYGLTVKSINNMFFQGTHSLFKKMLGAIDLRNVVEPWKLSEGTLPNLTTFLLTRARCSFDISCAPKISLDSINFWITSAINASAITITLHPDAYARVTDELFALAAEKNITIAST